ncbi:MAG: RrF2 family transcriptional regulator, partial [Candidatus Acidiferrales bacterium]
MLRSLRGTGGGYELSVPPDQIRLLTIVEAIDGSQMNDCVMEDHPCGHPAACLLHPIWATIRTQFVDHLERTTVADLARMRKLAREPIPKTDGRPEAIS